jgi:protein ImuB
VFVIVCVLFPRYPLAVAAGGRDVLAAGPVALAPEPGREQFIGEVSAAAEAYGLRPGLRLGEALARCPTLRLVAPDPAGVADAWDAQVAALEGIGAAVEAGPPGTAWFGAGGLRTLHGGTLEGVLAATRKALSGPVRLGAAPSRFAALAAASRARARRAEVTPMAAAALAAYMAPLPVSLLLARPEVAMLPEALERFGICTLGELAKLPRAALADRFGPPGARARDLAQGRDAPLVARTAAERLEERLELPESASGAQLQRGLDLLVDRLLARRERRGRTLRAVVLSAALVEGGTWRARVTFREPLADARRMRLVLGQKLAELPAPTDVLRLRAEGFGLPAGDQRSLLAEPTAIRRARLREAVRQARSVAGPDAALRIIPVDPDSRVPERRLALAPWDP